MFNARWFGAINNKMNCDKEDVGNNVRKNKITCSSVSATNPEGGKYLLGGGGG
jgi:hypothetical protein